MQVSQVQDDVESLVTAHGRSADPVQFRQIVQPMLGYVYGSMPKLEQASMRSCIQPCCIGEDLLPSIGRLARYK